jgi:hypothetical protein|tara:strand:- start:862 stop:963 length:102 start_codon:yes stop_codon:yes gene_type:complete
MRDAGENALAVLALVAGTVLALNILHALVSMGI